MNSEIRSRELYQEIILDHNRSPRNHYVMPNPTRQAQGFNPLCGDKVTIYLNIEAGLVKKASFIGQGCAISQASASLMTDALEGKTLQEVQVLFDQFHRMLTCEEAKEEALVLGKLGLLAGVQAYPARVKCATLAWHTLLAALNQSKTIVQTE